MSIEIDGIDFSGFPGRDFQKLGGLTFEGRVAWVEYRFRAFFLDTFDRLVSLEDESYIWLCVVNLLTSAVEALSVIEAIMVRNPTTHQAVRNDLTLHFKKLFAYASCKVYFHLSYVMIPWCHASEQLV